MLRRNLIRRLALLLIKLTAADARFRFKSFRTQRANQPEVATERCDGDFFWSTVNRAVNHPVEPRIFVGLFCAMISFVRENVNRGC